MYISQGLDGYSATSGQLLRLSCLLQSIRLALQMDYRQMRGMSYSGLISHLKLFIHMSNTTARLYQPLPYLHWPIRAIQLKHSQNAGPVYKHPINFPYLAFAHQLCPLNKLHKHAKDQAKPAVSSKASCCRLHDPASLGLHQF